MFNCEIKHLRWERNILMMHDLIIEKKKQGKYLKLYEIGN